MYVPISSFSSNEEPKFKTPTICKDWIFNSVISISRNCYNKDTCLSMKSISQIHIKNEINLMNILFINLLLFKN